MEVRILKKNFRRAMAAVMAAALTLSLAGTAADADAAKKKKIKLASKSVTVAVKKTKTVKIKNVKAKKVKKLTVKSASKKIATAKAKGKTAVKVTGKKAGKSTKVKITLKIKGQKKATKLTLKVKVSKAKTPVPAPATNAPAPATNAPNVPSTQAPGASQPPQGGGESAAPSTQKPPASKTPSTPKPPWTPDPGKVEKTEDVTISYGADGYLFEKADMVKFEDAAEGYPKDGIDVRYYDKVIVHYTSDVEIATKEDGENGSWGGKATLSTTDEGFGMSGYTDGLYRWYLNDMKYENGGYAVEYDVKKVGGNGGLMDGYDFDEVGFVDCVSVQLNYPYVDSEDNSEKGVNFRLRSIEFKAPEKAPSASAPAASAPAASAPAASAPAASAPAASAPAASAPAASATPTAPAVSLTVDEDDLTVGEKTAVKITSPVENVTVEERNLAVTNVTDTEDELAVLNADKTELEAKKKGTVKITGTVKIKYAGIGYTVPVTSGEIIIHAVDELVAEVNVDTSPIELLIDGTKTLTATGTATMNGAPVADATFTYTWASNDTSVVEVANGVITAKGKGETTVTVTAVAHKEGKTDSDPSRAVVIPVTVYGLLTVETGTIEFTKDEIAIGESVAPKALKGTAITTDGEIAETTWALADSASAEIASIDEKTGVVTGKKAGTVNVKATVKVTGPVDQQKTVNLDVVTLTVNDAVLNLGTPYDCTRTAGQYEQLGTITYTVGDVIPKTIIIDFEANENAGVNAALTINKGKENAVTDYWCNGVGTSRKITIDLTAPVTWGTPNNKEHTFVKGDVLTIVPSANAANLVTSFKVTKVTVKGADDNVISDAKIESSAAFPAFIGQYKQVGTCTYTVGSEVKNAFDVAFETTDGAQINFDVKVNDKVVANYGIGTAREKLVDLTKAATWGQQPQKIELKKGDVVTIVAVTGLECAVESFKFSSVTAKVIE